MYLCSRYMYLYLPISLKPYRSSLCITISTRNEERAMATSYIYYNSYIHCTHTFVSDYFKHPHRALNSAVYANRDCTHVSVPALFHKFASLIPNHGTTIIGLIGYPVTTGVAKRRRESRSASPISCESFRSQKKKK